MRILLTFVGGLGHLAPLLPLARAAAAAGHEVAVAGSGGLVGHIESAGLRAYATSAPRHHDEAPAARDLTPLRTTDPRAAEVEFAQNFASRGARRMADAVPRVIEDFRPDVVVRDETDLGTTIAAELLGVPLATHLVLASGTLVRPELVAPELDAVRAEHGLAPDPTLSRLVSGVVLSPFAPSFRSPGAPLRVDAAHHRTTAPDVLRPRRRRTGDRPRVYATLGTIFNTTSGDLLERLVAGLVAADVDAVVTVGRDVDPEALGPAPPRVDVRRFVPQDEALATADLVVSHGGSGSLAAALARGLPSVLVPLGADQPHNARRAAELGLAAVLDAAAASPGGIADAVSATWEDETVRGRCRAVAAEVAALPDVDAAVRVLELAARGG